MGIQMVQFQDRGRGPVIAIYFVGWEQQLEEKVPREVLSDV